jgi:nucleoside-diphosphate-sugar epimerase
MAPLIAVTGGGGFIGSHLVRALRNAGVSMRVLLGPLGAAVTMAPPGTDVCFGDITTAAALIPLMKNATAVVHLAGPPSVAGSFQDPLECARVHVVGTAAVVQACALARVRRLVYVSSADVYGQPENNPVREDAPLMPRSPYAAAKVAGEAFVRAGAVSAGMEVVIARPFIVYGPGMSPTSLVASLVRQVRQARIQVIDPRPIRDYCFVGDVVNGLMACCAGPLPEQVRVYNLGSGVGLSVAELAVRVFGLTGTHGAVDAAAPPDRPRRADIVELVGDSTRAWRELGWRATTGIDAGLAAMLESAPRGPQIVS